VGDEAAAAALALVVIGRNEGGRLLRCLDAIRRPEACVVYVDSGSSDGSPAAALARGVRVVALDPARPFSAARARNEGLDEVVRVAPGAELVQFLDGDCELCPGWLERAAAALRADPGLAVVSGRIRERERERSVYNLLCDLEWDAPAGEAHTCGGNAMMRIRAVREAGGFDPTLIAGEEPELAFRLRARGWRLRRLADDMVLHDAEMLRFGQWWRRNVRGGWAYAEGAALHGGSPERYAVRETLSNAFWGALLPLAVVGLAPRAGGLSALLLAVYPLLGARIYARALRRGRARRDAALQALFTVLGKLPQALGQAQYALLRAMGRRRRVFDWRTAS